MSPFKNRYQKAAMLLLFIAFLPFQLISQTNKKDSLQNIINTTTNITQKIDLLNELSWEYRLNDAEKSRSIAQEAFDLGQANGYLKGCGSAANTIGLIVMDTEDPKDALAWFDKSIAFKEQIGDKKGIATVINNKGISYVDLEDYKKAEECYRKSLKIRLELDDKKGIGDSYNQLGLLYRNIGDYDKAIEYLEKTKVLRNEINDTRGIAYSLVNIGCIYSDQTNYLKSISNLQEALPMLEKLNDKSGLVVVYNNLSSSNKKLKNFEESVKYCWEAIKIGEKSGHKSMLIGAYKNLGDAEFELLNWDLSLEAYDKALLYANELKRIGDQAHCYSGMGHIWEKKGDLDKANLYYQKSIELVKETNVFLDQIRIRIESAKFHLRQKMYEEAEADIEGLTEQAKRKKLKSYLAELYRIQGRIAESTQQDSSAYFFKQYAELKDSIYNVDLPKQFAYQQTKFETERKEAALKLAKQKEQITQLQLQEEKQRVQEQRLLVVLLVVTLLGIITAFYFYRRKQKSEALAIQLRAKQVAEEEERLRLAKDIHDEFGSGLTKISFVANLAIEKAAGQDQLVHMIQPIAKTAGNLVENMRDLIWVLNPGNNTLEILLSRIREYANDYLEDLDIATEFHWPSPIPTIEISKEAHRHLIMVVKEAIQNATKHANASRIYFEVTTSSTHIQLTIRDNGKGFVQDASFKAGNGLRNMKQRMDQIGAQLHMESNSEGTSIILTLMRTKS
ncbi:MAG TPA: tetratricopeptide repeat protein [Flavobacteriales bacterium]|nr:tetratricopeptide repeat protein [Flavobacteriales bacterium]